MDEQRLADIFERITDAVVALDADWRYTFVSKKAGALFSRRPEELIGKHIWTEFPEGIGQPFYKAYYKAMETQQFLQIEEYYPPYDRWFENRIYPSKQGLTIFFTDVTERKKAEEALKEKEHVLHLVIEYSPAALAMFDRNMKYIAASRRFLADYQLGEQDLVGRSHYEVFPEMPERWKEIHRRCLAGAIEKCDQDPFPRADGSLDWVRWEIRPWYEPTGKIGGIVLFSEVITERKKTEEELRSREALLKQVIEIMPVGVWLTDETGNIIMGNKAGQAIWAGARYVGMEQYGEYKRWRVNTGKKREAEEWALARAVRKGEVSINEEIEIECFDGTHKIILNSAVPILADDNKIKGAIVINQDITERKRAEDQLRERERQLSTLINNLPGAVFRVHNDPNYTAEYVSNQITELTGFPADDFRENRRHFGDLMHPDDRERIWNETQKALGEHRPYELTYRFIDAKGKEKWNWERGVGIFDQNGELQAVEGFILDITNRKWAEEEIRATNEGLRAINRIIAACTATLNLKDILENILDETLSVAGLEGGTICLTTPEETLKLMAQRSASQETITDFTVNKIKIGECLCGTCAKDKTPLILPDRESVLKYSSREAQRKEDIRFHAAFPLITAERCIGVLCIFTRTDKKLSPRSLELIKTVTPNIALAAENALLFEERANYALQLEVKIAERTRELSEANERLKELDRIKSMFIASMSHELRTPLNSIIGFSSILLKGWAGPINDEQRENLSIMLSSGKHLLALINDVIDVSKIEAGAIEPFIEEFDLADVISEAVLSIATEVNDKALRLEINSPHLNMKTDRRRLLQCLLNLLSNAVKFTENGKIEIQTTSDNSFAEISVADTGIGIKEKDMNKLFTAFLRIESPLKRPGTGLGLYLTKKLVTEILKGEIRAESVYGKGSRFRMRVPVRV